MTLAEIYPWALGLSGFVYCLAMLALTSGMRRLRPGASGHQPSVSIVVAARDEEGCIRECIEALIAQHYPPERLEILIVDDRSADRTHEIASSYELRHVRVLRVKERRYACPKKNALALGIAQSRGEIILTTDADCRPGPAWVAGTVRHFDPDTGMVAGHSAREGGKGPIAGLLRLEDLAKAGLSAGSIGLGMPLSCTGRNLAFRRSAFEAAGGYDRVGHIISGDDVLLLRELVTRTGWRVRFAAEPETSVPTSQETLSLSRLYNQKARHACKAVHYGARILVPAGVIYLFHLLLLAGVPAAIYSAGGFSAVWLGLAAKGSVDCAFLVRSARLFGGTGLLRYLPLLEAVYLPYVVIFTPLGAFRKFTWKPDIEEQEQNRGARSQNSE